MNVFSHTFDTICDFSIYVKYTSIERLNVSIIFAIKIHRYRCVCIYTRSVITHRNVADVSY